MYGEQSELGLGNSRRRYTVHGRSDRKQVQKSVLGYSLAYDVVHVNKNQVNMLSNRKSAISQFCKLGQIA